MLRGFFERDVLGVEKNWY